ncbi:hypothetical protein ABI_31890 [Asticcacaulis biprosthecium C19]|uniref:TonB C-terminal domain-containing protein n=1 Tax=Asticcacaulis biprosthecium C19 TaxID=715226 RepID=F4QRP8_9CAUL|nr:hypothetical protein [Asticcacaulis biprosthecium]EGF90174.1 hypothetical protein ABI_31890 [Asticcacaulis biprosthecium C19]
MKRAWVAIATGAAMSAMTVPALAAEPVYLGDVQIVHQPPPSGYQPEGTDFDLADQGKTFDVACAISGDGKLSGCEADENDLYDQKFITIATANVSQWVLAPQTASGQSVAGRTLVVTVQFTRADRIGVAAAGGAK